MPPHFLVVNAISPRGVEVNIGKAVLQTVHFEPSFPSDCQIELKAVAGIRIAVFQIEQAYVSVVVILELDSDASSEPCCALRNGEVVQSCSSFIACWELNIGHFQS